MTNKEILDARSTAESYYLVGKFVGEEFLPVVSSKTLNEAIVDRFWQEQKSCEKLSIVMVTKGSWYTEMNFGEEKKQVDPV